MKAGWKGAQTASPEETISLGKNISSYLEKGDVLALIGDLASGKTTFIKGVLEGMNYTKTVTSPTFTLINEYDAKYRIIHIDFYREDNPERWVKIGFHDYINAKDIMVIEWADKILNLLPDDYIHIEFVHKGKNKRQIRLIN